MNIFYQKSSIFCPVANTTAQIRCTKKHPVVTAGCFSRSEGKHDQSSDNTISHFSNKKNIFLLLSFDTVFSAIYRAIRQTFCQIRHRYFIISTQISNRSSDSFYAIVSTRRHPHFLCCNIQKVR